MKKMAMWGAIGCLVMGLSACTGGGPTMPLDTAKPGLQAGGRADAAVGGVVVTSSKDAYFVGETEVFAAAIRSDGGGVPITDGIWATDTPNVATVNAAGLVTIVGQGWANISCTSGGLTGSKQIWGRVDCRGTWSGTYSVRRCELFMAFPDPRFCETQGGSELPIELVLNQYGEVLRGTIKLGDLSTPFVALPLLDGSLEMEGEILTVPYVTNVAVGCNWTPSGPAFNMMLYYYRGDRALGQAMLYCDLSLNKTGAGI